MGFKRTSEGRIFFQGTDDGANDRGPAGTNTVNAGGLGAGLPQGPQMQAQILTLLKTLNERLKATQADRARMAEDLQTYRSMILELKNKSDHHERAYQALERKIAQGEGQASHTESEALAREALKELQDTRALLLELEDKADRADRGVSSLMSEVIQTRKMGDQLRGKQLALESSQKEQAEVLSVSAVTYAELTRRIKDNEEKHESLNAKIEETGAQQARLVRKMDKAMEDRARFMRKIERIEETVIQTRDSLNAKAMVLLTDQGVAGTQTGFSGTETQDELQAQLSALQAQTHALPEGVGEYSVVWWRKPYRIQATGLGVLMVACLLGGWWISQIQQPALPVLEAYEAAEQGSAPEESKARQAVPETGATGAPEALAPVDMAKMDWSIDTKNGATGPVAPAVQGPPVPLPPPIQDDIGMRDIQSPADVDALLQDKSPEEVASALNAIAPTTPEPARAPVKITDPKTLAKPDSALPASVKTVEEQAFAGVPEAQHDLAAIYTAGHGGVKQDYKRAAFWFEQAADRNIANAAYNLGVLHHQGLGMKSDMKSALSWYQRAADLGHPEAQYNLGIAYIEGIGVPYNPEKAAGFFTKAAKKNVMEAAYNLGLIYENGLLGEAKPDEALLWYKTAADQGSPEAKEALTQLAKTLNIKLEDVNRLVEGMKVIHKSEAVPLSPKTEKQTPVLASVTLRDTIPVPSPAPQKTGAQAALVAQIQDYLVRMALFPGPSDGVMSPLTQDAIRSYQLQQDLNPDGLATQGLLTHMLLHSSKEAL